MARISANARVIAIKVEPATARQALMLALLLIIGLLASVACARAEGVAVEPPQANAGIVAYSWHIASTTLQNETTEACKAHGSASAPCFGANCCSSVCHMALGFVASSALLIPAGVLRALPASEASDIGSLSPDAFRPPIG